MQNIAPSRALTRRSQQLMTLALVVFAAGVFVTALGILIRLIPLAPIGSALDLQRAIGTIILMIGIMLLIGALIMLVRARTWKVDNDLAKITGDVLARSLDNSYTLIRNISKREIGYVDAVLVGVPGVLVFRILDNEGEFANEGPNWLVKDPRANEWKPAGIEPTRECVADVEKIREFLVSRGMTDIPIFGVVVFTKEQPLTILKAREPVVPITPLSALLENLRPNYLAVARLNPTLVQPIIDALYR